MIIKCNPIPSPECLDAVKKNGYALAYIIASSVLLYETPEICLAAVKQNGMALKFVIEQSHEICLAAVKQNRKALRFVKDKTPEILAAAEELSHCGDHQIARGAQS